MIKALAHWIRGNVMGCPPWTPVYGWARTLLAAATGLTLLANPLSILMPLRQMGASASSFSIKSLGLFSIVPFEYAEIARLLAGLVLLGVASGYRPRYTGVVHWWLTFSLSSGCVLIDGGDQLASILTLLLIPVTLTDSRRWHWSAGRVREGSELPWLLASICLGIVRLQVAGVYFHAAVAKFSVPQWVDGTALYYWMLHPTFGSPEWLRPLIEPLLLSGAVVTGGTWSVLLLEFLLAAGLIADRSYRPGLFVAGFLLHSGIILIHGLVSFGLVMFAALILFLVPRGGGVAPRWPPSLPG